MFMVAMAIFVRVIMPCCRPSGGGDRGAPIPSLARLLYEWARSCYAPCPFLKHGIIAYFLELMVVRILGSGSAYFFYGFPTPSVQFLAFLHYLGIFKNVPNIPFQHSDPPSYSTTHPHINPSHLSKVQTRPSERRDARERA